MIFTSPVFLFGFLPILLLIYFSAPSRLKNPILLLSSIVFYAWGEVFYTGVMLVSIVINYYVGLHITKNTWGNRKLILSIGVASNLILLGTFKYANFISDNINIVLNAISLPSYDLAPIHLPLGISFFTFQAISYIVDVYRKEAVAQKNILDLALYISLFPQLVAGPIVRYHDIAQQIFIRTHSVENFSSGAQRFALGLAKKMLIANPLGAVADTAFATSGSDLTMPIAWIGIVAYSLQIYFDFSAYSDMAIGLGRIFGFTFLENFNYPYISKSIREFWRRWHISLSSWFRDYVYIPLGGNRLSTTRTYLNLSAVFLLTGIWHGASWNFIVWGAFHGFFLAIEHAGFSTILKKLWSPLQHLYLLLIVMVGWVLFRAENLPHALSYLNAMFDINRFTITTLDLYQLIDNEALIAFFFALIFSTPLHQKIISIVGNEPKVNVTGVMYLGATTFVFYLAILKVSSSTYNPFIYFRF